METPQGVFVYSGAVGGMTRGPDGKPWSMGDLPAELFPVTMTAFVGDEEIWERVLTPYTVIEIPAPPDGKAGQVRVRFRFGNGEEIWEEAVSKEEADAYIEERIAEE